MSADNIRYEWTGTSLSLPSIVAEYQEGVLLSWYPSTAQSAESSPMRTWPLYAGGLMLFIGTPLALGSYWGLLAFLATLPVA